MGDVMRNSKDSIMYARAIMEHWEHRPDMVAALDTSFLGELAGRPWPWSQLLHNVHQWGGFAVMFVSGQKPVTRVHADIGESFALLTEGEKEWRFFGPESSMLLRPKAEVSNLFYPSVIDVWAPDFDSQPHLRF